MIRSRMFVVAAILTILHPTAVSAAQPRSNAAAVPDGIDVSVLRTPSRGPVVAIGRLTDATGRAAVGTVAVTAWPNEASRRKQTIGSSVATPTVGWATTRSDGAFTLSVDPGLFPTDYVESDGSVNLQALGWTATSQGRWSFPARLTAFARASRVTSRPAPEAIVIETSAPLSTLGRTATAPVSPQVATPCTWFLQSTFDAPVVIGFSWPYGNDTGWMKSASSHTEKVGVGASQTGTYGSWSANGSSSTTSGTTFTWSESVSYRDFRDEHRYGIYRYRCALWTNNWMTQEMYGTGGHTSSFPTPGTFTYSCPAVDAGVWSRESSTGYHLALSAGVQSASKLGINLSVDSNYDSSHVLNYRLISNGKVCGDNAVPALASRVRTTR